LTFRFTHYGRRELIAATLIYAVLAAIGAQLAARYSPWFWTMGIIAGIGWLWVLAFFRDPDRAAPAGPGLFVSPADGRVADITPLGPDSPLGCPGAQIGVFMNVLNVHVNRAPCDGRIEDIVHRPGAFLDVRTNEAILRNESATITLSHAYDGRRHPVIVRQVAGLVARRIVTDLKVGQTVHRGERIGMIKFGSRLELLIPNELLGEIRVQVGQRVRGGLTVLVAAGPLENQ